MRANGETTRIHAKGPPRTWSMPTIALHWLSAALIIGLLALGWFMVHGDIKAATKFDLYQLHKSLGFLSVALLLLRLCARIAWPAPQAPPAMPRWERRIAGLTHLLFYALLLVAFLSGWLLASAAIIPIPTRFFDLFVIPNLGALEFGGAFQGQAELADHRRPHRRVTVGVAKRLVIARAVGSE